MRYQAERLIIHLYPIIISLDFLTTFSKYTINVNRKKEAYPAMAKLTPVSAKLDQNMIDFDTSSVEVKC